jgi:ABC-type Fe3+-hydroxamate transport system substrate-binding protein
LNLQKLIYTFVFQNKNNMSKLLEALYDEYKGLKQRLDKVADLIVDYGGKLPTNSSEEHFPAYTQGSFQINTHLYPSNGTWKEKILFVMKVLNEDTGAKEISKKLEAFERQVSETEGKEFKPELISNMVTQYTSTMGKNGEIGVRNDGYRNTYFLNSNS